MKNFIISCINIIGLFLIALLILLGNINNGVILSLVSLIFIYFFVKKVKIKRFMVFLILFSLVTKIVCVLILKTPILADYWIMYEASQNMINGDYSFVNELYFLTWGYQLFHVFYEAFVLGFMNDILVLKILNCIYSTVITIMIYLITRKITSENTARIVSLLYSIAIYPLYLNSVLGNQQLALMLMLIGIYILLFKNNNIKNLIIVGILIALSNLERPEAIIYLLTILVYYIISNQKLKITIKNCFIIFITYFIITKGSSFFLIKSGINDIGFENKNPYWKFVTGFSYDTNGIYNLDDVYYADVSNVDDTKKEAINRISQVHKWPRLFYEKTKIIWLYNGLEECFNAKSINISDDLKQIIFNYIKIMNMVIIILVLVGLYKNKNINHTTKFFLINILIYFAVYLIIEVHIRYYFNPQVSMFILSSIGIERVLNYIDNRKRIVGGQDE